MQNDPEDEQQTKFLVEPTSSTALEGEFDETIQSLSDVEKVLERFQCKVRDATREKFEGCRGDAGNLNITFRIT